MNKTIAMILFLALCGCNKYQTQQKLQEEGRIQFKEFKYTIDVSLSIVAIDSIEFLINNRTGHMVRITEGGDQ